MKERADTLNKNYTISFKLTDCVFVAILVMIGVLFTEFFYRQTIRYNGMYVSDCTFYVERAKEGNLLRAISYIFHKLYSINGETFEIAIFLAIVIVATIIANYLLVTYILKKDGIDTARFERQIASLIVLFSGPIYMVGIHEYFYSKSWSKYAWHSPTHQMMTLFAILSIWLFLVIYEKYLEEINIWSWLGLLITSCLSAWAKPSFMLAFIPAVIILFLMELFRKNGYPLWGKFKRLFLFGCSMVPSGVYILYLNSRMFGEDKSNEVVVKAGYYLMKSDGLFWIVIFSIAFPLAVLAFNYRKANRISFKVTITVFLMGILEYILFIEDGTRMDHGNFVWGRMVGTYFVFLYAVTLALENIRDKSFLKDKKKLKVFYFVVITVLLLMHVVSQIWYLSIIITGEDYTI